MAKHGRFLDRIVYSVPVAILVGIFAVGTLQIVSRFLFALPFTWAEEVMRLFFVLLVFFGAVAVTRGREHLAVDILNIALKPRIFPRVWGLYRRFIMLLQALFFGLCAFGSLQMAMVRWEISSQTLSFWKIGYMYALACAALTGCTVVSLVQVFSRKEE